MALPYEVLSHTRKVCSLYKRALRLLECYHHDRASFRYQAVLLRDQFDQNSCETDMRKAVKLVEDGEEELFKNQHYQPLKFAKSPGGVAYARQVEPPDWVLDYWHPLEKAQYPDYFARREQRKKEFIEWWEKQYGKPTQDSHHH